MAESYVQRIRAQIGTSLLLLPSVAAILRDSAGRILFHQQTDDYRWGLPASAIECGEDP